MKTQKKAAGNRNYELEEALREQNGVRALFSEAGFRLTRPAVTAVPTWRGTVAAGIVSVLDIEKGIKVYVGVKTPAVAATEGETVHAFRTRFGVWICEYSGTIAGKSVIAIDCIKRRNERVWWFAAHIGAGRTSAIDDLCVRLGHNDRLKVASFRVEEREARRLLRSAAEWARDMHRYAAVVSRTGS